MMIAISLVFVLGMAYINREGGGKIQKIVLEKQHTRYVRSACIIDAPYFLCLFFQRTKQYSNVNYLGICWIIMW